MSKLFLQRMQEFIILLILILQFDIIAETDDKPKDPEETTVTSTEGSIAAGETFSMCFDPLGCIASDETWFHKEYRPVNLKPLLRDAIKTEFIIIRKNDTSINNNDIFYQVITSTEDAIKNAGYEKGLFLFLLIHDFTSTGYSGWVKHISRVLKSRTKKCNIISADWHAGAQPSYDQAVANARVVALEIIFLVKFLKEKFGLTLDQVHLIGHGLGAHIAGYVGGVHKADKITGLDPSGPRFDGMPIHVRLDETDAEYVEVLHTDCMADHSQGAKSLLGHTDFFINNAELQPGCPEEQKRYDVLEVTRDMLKVGEVLPGCSHKRAYKYYIESLEVEECTFLGIKCESYLEFLHGKCTTCGDNCRTFGLVTYTIPNNGSYFLQTESRRPFCLYQYRVTIDIKGTKSKYFGFFEFILIDTNHFTTTSSMLAPRDFKPGSDNTFVFYAGVPEMGKIVQAKVGWFEKRRLFCIIGCKQAIDVNRVTIQSINSNTKFAQEISLCPKDGITEIQNGMYQEFDSCKK